MTSIAFVVGWALAALFAVGVCITYKALVHVLGENTDLRKKVRGLELAVENYAFSLKLERMGRNPITLNQTLNQTLRQTVRRQNQVLGSTRSSEPGEKRSRCCCAARLQAVEKSDRPMKPETTRKRLNQ